MSPIDRLRANSQSLPPPLRTMVARYADAATEGLYSSPKIFRLGARLLNDSFKRADSGDNNELDAMSRDGIDAYALVIAADLFMQAAFEIEQET